LCEKGDEIICFDGSSVVDPKSSFLMEKNFGLPLSILEKKKMICVKKVTKLPALTG
jgi:hypothetical protein